MRFKGKFEFAFGGSRVDYMAVCTASVLGQEEGYTVKYTPSPEGVPEGEARGNS